MLHASVRDNTRTTESMSKKYKTQRTRTAHTTTTTTTTRTHRVDSRLCFPVPMLLACWVHNCVTAPGTARGWRKWCRHLQQNGCAAQWSLEMVWRKTHRALPGAGASAAATSNKIGNYHRTRWCQGLAPSVTNAARQRVGVVGSLVILRTFRPESGVANICSDSAVAGASGEATTAHSSLRLLIMSAFACEGIFIM